MNICLRLAIISLIAISLAACGQQDLRLQATTKLTTTVSASGCQPGQWVVPGGAPITITFINNSPDNAQWTVLIYPATPPYTGMDKKNVYIGFSIPANSTIMEKFTAPAMPAEYQVLCGQADALDKTPKAVLVVAQP
ncbi:MAG: hypothetical protein ABSA51_12665 [Anaerolineaceae bacterium]|jgi:hypothetical protein